MTDELEEVWKHLEALAKTGELPVEHQLYFDPNTGLFHILPKDEQIPNGWLPLPWKTDGCLW
jgi:hypothetical protein